MTSLIKLIAIDLDGTLLNSLGQISSRTAQAIQAARAQGVQVILATGKSRSSATHIIEALDLDTPGVFTQGLVITNGDGSVRYETLLDRKTAVAALNFALEHQLYQILYCSNRLVVPEESAHRQMIFERFHEPMPDVIGPILPQLEKLAINKIILCSDNNNEAALRVKLQSRIQGVVTLSVSPFIEILPPNMSKGAGLRRLLVDLNISPANIMAIGDGENDIEMIQMAGIGIAMGNAAPRLKAVANHITQNNDNDGVAAAIEHFVLREGNFALQVRSQTSL